MIRKIRAFIDKVIEDRVFDLSAQVAYYLLMSFFPFLILIVSLAGTVLSNVNVLEIIADLFPPTIQALILDNAELIYEAQSPAIISVSFAVTAWLALNGVRTVMNTMDLVYGIEDTRGIVKRTLYSLLNLFAMTISIATSIIIAVWLGLDIVFREQSAAFLLIRGFLIFGVLFLALLFINSFMPAKKIHVRYTAIGSLFSAVVLIISTFIFGYYVTNIWQYSRIYGTIGTVIVFLVWLYLDGMILLLGSELNAFLMQDPKKKKSLKKD